MNLIEVTAMHEVPASPEQVFDLWIDPQRPGGPWFGSDPVILNPAANSLFYFVVQHEGRAWPHYGRFLRVERPHLLEFTWVSEATRGVESVVTVTFETAEDRTLVTLRHSGVPDDEMGRRHQDGWSWVLSMLAGSFATPGKNAGI